MDSTNEQSKLWSNTQAYAMAVVCLLLGVVSGYLLNPPRRTTASVPPAPQAVGTANAPPTPEQIKHMGDKIAAPLLASLQKDPNNADLLDQLGSVYFRTSQFPLAVDYYARSAKAKPNADTFVSLSNAQFYAGSADQAIDTLNQALKLDPKSASALFNLGMLRWQSKNDPKGAIEAWQQLLKTNPNHPRRAQVEEMIAKAREHAKMPAPAKSNKPTS
jgi:cytochrome c-type biogenesis protein CcmH/NrfG